MVIDRMGDLPRDIVIQKAEALGGGLVVMLLYIKGGEKGLDLDFETPLTKYCTRYTRSKL